MIDSNILWIPHPTILVGKLIKLIPLEHSNLNELYLLASDPALWEHVPTQGYERKKFIDSYETALKDRERGIQYPFVIIHKLTGKSIGSTRFFEISARDRKLEIGWTWLTRKYWGTGLNQEVKTLQLQFCFEELKTVRVQFKTDENNIRSRKAIEKIGARLEGIFRKDRLRDNGSFRNTVYYSIVDDEWPSIKSRLEEKVK